MNEIKYISSLQNTLVKQFLSLKEKSRERKKTGFFVIEGRREIQLCQQGDYQLSTVLFYADIISQDAVVELIKDINTTLIEISKEVYQKLAYRETTEGVVAIVIAKEHTLESLQLTQQNPLILVAEAPEKPGNIGALLRTADAANLDAVIIADPKGDLYNPNIVRSSVGCVFTTNIALASTTDILHFLQEKNVKIFCAALSASKTYTDVNFTEAAAIVVGTEATGLTPKWLDSSDQNIIIPMEGEIDSMNVSVAAAILLFEAKRQRTF